MLDCSKMVSQRCRLQSMVVQERNYIEWTNGDTTVNTSDIREEYLFHITSSEFFLLQEKPMGAVSVFMVGNYLNQPFRDLLCFAWCCCFLLCVYSSNELVEKFFPVLLDSIWRQIPVGLDLTSVTCWDVESGSKTNESCVNWRRSIVLRYWRASLRSRRWLLCL